MASSARGGSAWRNAAAAALNGETLARRWRKGGISGVAWRQHQLGISGKLNGSAPGGSHLKRRGNVASSAEKPRYLVSASSASAASRRGVWRWRLAAHLRHQCGIWHRSAWRFIFVAWRSCAYQ